MENTELDVGKPRQKQVIGYFEDLEILSHDYNRAVLIQVEKLNQLLHKELIKQYQYDVLNKALLNISAALDELPNTIEDIK